MIIQLRRVGPLALAMLVGCLEGDPNPTSGQASSSGSSGQVPPAATIQPSSACSAASTQAVNLPFRNAFSDRTVRLFWVDTSCREIAYSAIASGQTFVQQTFVGHVWRVRDASTNALYKEVTPTTTAPPEVTVP